jgi:hypothetical protein
LFAEGVKYEVTEYDEDDSEKLPITGCKLITIDSIDYYDGDCVDYIREEGLIAKKRGAHTWRISDMFALAASAGWFVPEKGRKIEHHNGAIRGFFRVGGRIWMSSNGVGLIVYDTGARTWARYDVRAKPVESNDMTLEHADEDYLFVSVGGSLHVRSMRSGRWLEIKGVPTTHVTSYGWSDGMFAIDWDHRPYAAKEYLPIDFTLAHPDNLTARRTDYLFENEWSERSRTVFRVTKKQLAAAFRRRT